MIWIIIGGVPLAICFLAMVVSLIHAAWCGDADARAVLVLTAFLACLWSVCYGLDQMHIYL